MSLTDNAILRYLYGVLVPPDTIRFTDLSSTDRAIKTTPGILRGWNIINPNASRVYVKFYNATTANVTVGSTTPLLTLDVPASGSIVFLGGSPILTFSTAITVAAVTGLADSDSTAPGTALHARFFFK